MCMFSLYYCYLQNSLWPEDWQARPKHVVIVKPINHDHTTVVFWQTHQPSFAQIFASMCLSFDKFIWNSKYGNGKSTVVTAHTRRNRGIATLIITFGTRCRSVASLTSTNSPPRKWDLSTNEIGESVGPQ